jgi:hypothetical protein
VTQASDTLSSTVLRLQTDAHRCATSDDPLGCQSQIDLKAATAFDEFTSTVEGVQFTGASAADAQRVLTDTREVSAAFRDLAAATGSTSQYEAAIKSTHFQSKLENYQTDLIVLQNDLP